MTNRSFDRVTIAISLGIFVALAHLGALTVILFSAWKFVLSPAVQDPLEPFLDHVFLFRGELVIPYYTTRIGNSAILRFVDLQSGKTRELDTLGVSGIRGIVTDGKTIWGIGQEPQIYESDGKNGEVYRTKRHFNVKPSLLSPAFLYEGRPAVIDHDDNNVAHLVVLVNREWEDRGQIVLPGVDRVWTIDEQTGKTEVIPATQTLLGGFQTQWRPIHVTPARGEYHLFRIEPMPGTPANLRPCRINHRVGFEFVVSSGENEIASASAPDNVPAEATGWSLLPMKLSWWRCSFAVHNGELLIVAADETISKGQNVLDSHTVWKQVTANDPWAPAKFERLTTFKFTPDRGQIRLVSSIETDEIYALLQSRFGDMEFYRLDGDQFVKLPFQVNGQAAPLVRRLGLFVSQIVAVCWIGTLLFIIAVAWLTVRTGQASFSFGQETVPLSHLVRRTFARTIDFVFILSPLVIQVIWRLSQAKSETILFSLFRDPFYTDRPHDLLLLAPALVWAAVAWVSLVFLTALRGISLGKWLCGIRVVRSTLRSCGFARALLRELMLWIDAPLCLTGVPAVISWLATDYCQRIGDLVADTLVIDVRQGPVGENRITHQELVTKC